MKVKDPSFKPFCLTCVEYEAAAGARCELWVHRCWFWLDWFQLRRKAWTGVPVLTGWVETTRWTLRGGPARCAATGVF